MSRSPENRAIPDVLLAMGFREDRWNSSQFWTQQLFDAMERELGSQVVAHSPELGRNPHFWNRRWRFAARFPHAKVFQLMDQSYGDCLLGVRGCLRVALVHDIAFWRQRRWWNAGVRRRILRGLQSAEARVAVSQSTADEMTALGLKVDAVIGPGFDLQVFSHFSAPRDPHLLLHVGTVGERKGGDRLLRLLAELPSQYRLLQVGGNWTFEELRLLRDLGLEGRVVQQGAVSRGSLVRAYQTAAALVFPSRYEGYGMPPVEARLVGTRVVVDRFVPALSVLGSDLGTTAVDFRCFDRNGNADERRRVAASLFPGASEPVVLANRERFAWDRSAQAFLELYERLGFERPRYARALP